MIGPLGMPEPPKPYEPGPVTVKMEFTADEFAVMASLIAIASGRSDALAKMVILLTPKPAIASLGSKLEAAMDGENTRIDAEDKLKSVEGEKNVS